MGYHNAVLFIANWSHVAERPFRVGVTMALYTDDRDLKPVYYGGWRLLAQALRPPFPTEQARVRQFKEATVKAITGLVEAGAVTRLEAVPANYRHQRYLLDLTPADATHGVAPDANLVGGMTCQPHRGIQEEYLEESVELVFESTDRARPDKPSIPNPCHLHPGTPLAGGGCHYCEQEAASGRAIIRHSSGEWGYA